MNMLGAPKYTVNKYLWMIRIHERSDEHGFPDDVAQRDGKICPPLKSYIYIELLLCSRSQNSLFWACLISGLQGAWLASQAQASHGPAEMANFTCLIHLADISLAQPILCLIWRQ
jgi:hypothetical protein